MRKFGAGAPHVDRILELETGVQSVVIGTIYKNMKVAGDADAAHLAAMTHRGRSRAWRCCNLRPFCLSPLGQERRHQQRVSVGELALPAAAPVPRLAA